MLPVPIQIRIPSSQNDAPPAVALTLEGELKVEQQRGCIRDGTDTGDRSPVVPAEKA